MRQGQVAPGNLWWLNVYQKQAEKSMPSIKCSRIQRLNTFPFHHRENKVIKEGELDCVADLFLKLKGGMSWAGNTFSHTILVGLFRIRGLTVDSHILTVQTTF